MEKFSGEALQLLYGLLPGFVAAWIYHSFTAHEAKKEQWERILQALIFTGIIKVMVICVGWLLLLVGKWHSAGTWTETCGLVWSYIIAIVFGLIAAFVINKDWMHSVGRTLNFTKQLSAPSEWCHAFDSYEWYVVLHLKGGKRLYGWPEMWPNKCDSGHFSITQPAWFRDDGAGMTPMYQLKRMLIPAADVTMVEMYKRQEELDKLGMTVQQITDSQKPLASLHNKEKLDGKRSKTDGRSDVEIQPVTQPTPD